MTSMNGKSFLLDTNILIGLFAKDKSILNQLSEAEKNGLIIYVPVICIGELYYGAEQSIQKENNLKRIEGLTEATEVLECDENTAAWYGKIKSQLKLQGKPIPENDIWIAALSKQYNLVLVTRDNHFKNIQEIELAEW